MQLAVGGRYVLHERLGTGGAGSVYRATDRLTGQVVALKQVALPAANQPSASSHPTGQTDALRLTLANEFQVLASLHHPYIIGVLDYGFIADSLPPGRPGTEPAQGRAPVLAPAGALGAPTAGAPAAESPGRQPFFTMEYLEGAQTIVQAAAGCSVAVKAGLLIQILQALAYLHRRGILHRDLKPGNVLVTAAGRDGAGTAKVLDFGLSMPRERAAGVAGTIAYMAPEVLREGRPPDEASDLYAVGVIAYELLAGRHPFATSDVGRLLLDILHTKPDLAAIQASTDVVDLVGRLLEKDPARRIRSAEACIAELSRAAKLPQSVESAAIRDSFLQAARFVGRDAEMEQLAGALERALAGQGAIWMVGGESGVGKSRLLEELRIRALVAGALVVRGQGVVGGGMAYQYWREPLRRLALSTELADLDLAILKPVVPDIELLAGRQVPEVPALDGQAGRQRLLDTMIGVLRRQTSPVVLLLEDLQWSAESLDVLGLLGQVVGQLPLLVVGSYRDDERPDLPAAVPGAQVIKLDRLSTAEIALLSASMLGEAGKRAQVVNLLQRESEGNAFFLVEVVRVLAEEAGRLSGIGDMTLPVQVFPRGIQTIVRRRLARVAAEAQVLLRLAAVAGRQIDLAVLQRLAGGVDVDDWLTRCANAAVVEIRDGRWRFAHDKLREGLLATLSQPELIALHRQVAEAIEGVHEDGGLAEQAAALAYHWRITGDSDKERHFARLAAEHAAARFVNAEAIDFFSRAIDLAPPDDLSGRYALLLARERVTDLMGRREAQRRDLAELETLAGMLEPDQQAAAALRQANYAYVIGDYPVAIAAAQRAIRLAQAAGCVPAEANGHWQWGMALYRQARFSAARAEFAQALALAQRAGMRQVEGDSLRGLGNVSIELADYGRAQEYYEQALAVSREIGDRRGEAGALNNLGDVLSGLGDYAPAHDYYQQSLAFWRATGDRWSEGLTLINLGGTCRCQGDHQSAQAYLEQTLAIKREIGDRSGEAYALTHLGHALFGLGRLAEAGEVYREAADIRHSLGEYHLAVESIAGMARVALARTPGDTARAMDYVELVLAHLRAEGNLQGAEEPFWVYLTCYQVLESTGDPRADSILASARAQLLQQAARIGDGSLRNSFLGNVPSHREIMQAAGR